MYNPPSWKIQIPGCGVEISSADRTCPGCGHAVSQAHDITIDYPITPPSGGGSGGGKADGISSSITGDVGAQKDAEVAGAAPKKHVSAINLSAIRNIGPYGLLDEIARGGMGIVYRARQHKLNRIVALKVMLAGEHASERHLRRFLMEARAAAKLTHPNIVPIYDVGEEVGLHYFTMEYVTGRSLARCTD